MRLVHTMTLSVFIKPEEDAAAVEHAFLTLVPLDFRAEKIKVERSTAEGFEGRSIRILAMRLPKQRHIQAVLRVLNERLSERDKDALRTQENRLDTELAFFLRLSKSELIQGELELTDGGECVHLRLALAAYPKNRETALAIVPKLFPQTI